MKKTFVASLIILASISAQAAADDCKNIIGQFACSFAGTRVALDVTQNANFSLKVLISGEGQDEIITDGNEHDTQEDDTTYTATCEATKGLTMVTMFKGKTETVVISPSSSGVQYVTDEMTLDCPRR